MDYAYLENLRTHPAWRLLRAENAAFIISFFHFAFVKNNTATHSQSSLVGRLDDYRHLLKDELADGFPRSSQEYLDAWSSGESAYLRKYYPARGDEPEYDLVPAVETVMEWLTSLQRRPFVGTESRLMAIFELLRDVIQYSEAEPATRMAALERRRAELELEWRELKAGIAGRPDPTRVKERYFQLEDMIRRLFADFRQVEENFRELDRRTREKIATSSLSKGLLLDEIFGEEHAIADSDEGRSFRAFWEFLLSPTRQQELEELTGLLMGLETLKDVSAGAALPSLKYRLMESGEKVKTTLDSLVDHLRRFLDDRAWIENRRIMDLIRSVERRALELREKLPDDPAFMELDGIRPDLTLTMARGLARPSKKAELSDMELREGASDFDSGLLYGAHFVDEQELLGYIQEALEEAPRVTLDELCLLHPLKKGLSELVAYLGLASRDTGAVFDGDAPREVSWEDATGRRKTALLPRVIFARKGEGIDGVRS